MREAAASIVVGSFESLKPGKDELRFLEKEPIPWFVLFKRNIDQDDHPSLASSLLAPAYKACQQETPLLVAVDQEGGRVSRLSHPFPNQGCALRACLAPSEEQQIRDLFQYGKDVAQALLKIGINVNFAPVVDILSNPLNTGVGDRAFGTSVFPVNTRAGAFLRGMHSVGVWGCLKHFPGQGSELSDPHNEKVIISVPKDLLLVRELEPYQSLLHEAKMVMVSHCTFLALDSKPASLSSIVITDLLKHHLKFDGLVLSDDMNMKAIVQDPGQWKQAIVASVAAGVNAVLVCSGLDNWARAIDALEAEGRRSESFANLLYSSAEKMLQFRRNYLRR